MLVRFIAHAGVSIEEDGYSVLIDPWFFDSTPEHPVIESIGGGFKTIDFQIPKTTENIERYAPDAILVSHFHPHHSPIRDIRTLCENALANSKPICICHPETDDKIEAALAERVVPNVSRRAMRRDETHAVGPFTITAKGHTVPFHQTWEVRSATGAVLHIGDGRLNKDTTVREIDSVWTDLARNPPSLLFLSSGGHNARILDKDGRRRILPSGIFTPVEAAQVVQAIAPRAAAAFGFYNHSIFKNRTEYILPAYQTEEEFQWALDWLAPAIRNVRLKPGLTFGIGDDALFRKCDIYLER